MYIASNYAEKDDILAMKTCPATAIVFVDRPR